MRGHEREIEREREGKWKWSRQRAKQMKHREADGGIVWKMKNQK